MLKSCKKICFSVPEHAQDVFDRLVKNRRLSFVVNAAFLAFLKSDEGSKLLPFFCDEDNQSPAPNDGGVKKTRKPDDVQKSKGFWK